MDGTLAEYEGNHHAHIGRPLLPMVERIKGWIAAGKEVRIFTARVSHGLPHDASQHELIRVWTTEHCGQALVATCMKDDGCEMICDDRARQVEFNTGRVL